MNQLDPKVCYRALRTHDERFDGRLFVGVTSTGIYCRPVCPAPPAKAENCRFFVSAASAQESGFRPCLRCRPETAPDTGSWRGTSNTVTRGLTLIAEGEMDGDEASVESLADRLGVGSRQLRRLFTQHLGASPVSVAQTRRIHFAKQLIHDTRLPMSEVALASGFGSIRRFNETFRNLYQRPPTELRRKTGMAEASAAGVTVKLRYRAPYDWEAMLDYLRARAIEGIEQVGDDYYRRTLSESGQIGTVEVIHLPDVHSLSATIQLPNIGALSAAVARIRRVFDLGADVSAIGEYLSQDKTLAPLIAKRPGLHVPGSWDGFECAMRAVLGQQVTVQSGRRLVGQLARLCGTSSGDGPLSLAFPAPAQVAKADLTTLGMPGARKRTLASIAEAALADPRLFKPMATVEETVEKLCAIRGVGDWTAHYIALRAAREPDAFPASDIGLLRGAARNGQRPTPSQLLDRAERWRPWRAYAAQHLWTADSESA